MPYRLVDDKGQLADLTPELLLNLLQQLRQPQQRLLTTTGLADMPTPTDLPRLARTAAWADLANVPPQIVRLAALSPQELDRLLTPQVAPQVIPQVVPACRPPATVRAVSTTQIQVLQGLQVVDSVETVDGDAVLLTGQPNQRQNGPWVVHVQQWTRPAWWTHAHRNDWFQALLGRTNAGAVWIVDTPGIARADVDPIQLVRSV